MVNRNSRNYQAWLVQAGDFPQSGFLEEQLKFLLRYAVLAPSTHNSQPWQFQVSAGAVTFLPNFKRNLPVGDPRNRFLYFSLGTALENFVVAAEYFGLVPTINYPSNDKEPITVLFDDTSSGERAIDKDVQQLFSSISRRVTYRAPFKAEEVPGAIFESLKVDSEADVRVDIVFEPANRAALAKIIAETTHSVMSRSAFRKELASYVRTNVTRQGTGMPSFVMGVSTLPSLVIPWLFKLFDISKFRKKKAAGARSAPAFGVISTVHDNPEAWVKAGQVFERIALKATALDAAVQPLVSPIHDGNHYQDIQKVLGITERPQFIFRIGLPAFSAPHTPRLTVEETVV